MTIGTNDKKTVKKKLSELITKKIRKKKQTGMTPCLFIFFTQLSKMSLLN